MANFDKFKNAGSAKAISNAAQAEKDKAQAFVLQYISNENLIDNPNNGENTNMTEDLEESMRQNGFTDPLEVTDFGMEEGKYMILSGHRRRRAGVKMFGESYVFPCIIRHFKTEYEAQNYTLMANSQRDSAKDPCLYCGRYKMHEEYLISIGFKGSKREEIAKRLGISVQQADRYNTMNKVILPVWDMVRAEVVGMSSVMPMGSHTEEEQNEILAIMNEALSEDVTLTRDIMKSIVDGFRAGKKTWADISGKSGAAPFGGPLMGEFINDTPNSSSGLPSERGHSDSQGGREYDPINAEYDAMERDQKEWEKQQAENAEGDSDEVAEDDVTEEKHEPTPEEKALKLGADIAKQLHKLDTSLGSVYKVEDTQAAREMVLNMSSVAKVLIDEIYHLTDKWNMKDEFDAAHRDIKESLNQYKN